MTKKKLGSVKNTDEVVITACDLANDVTGTLPVTNGGTGQTTYTNGQLLIGNTTGNTLTKATLTQGTGITITNGAGSITIASTVSGADYVAKAGDNMTGVLELNESTNIISGTSIDLGAATGNTVAITKDAPSYASKSLSVSSQETDPYGLSFSSDGTKCYVVGLFNDTIYQYTLSTAWDISTGSYASKSLSVSSQDTSPRGIAFSSDGTKCYVVGASSATIYQYTLSTAWDISTGSYASKSMSVSSQETNPHGLSFSSDGTKCYVVGTVNDTIYQYTLSTAWDISTGSYASKSLSVVSQEENVLGIAFSSDGTKCYTVGTNDDTVYQYTLGTAWDISTGNYSGSSMSVSSQEINPYTLAFSSDGTKCYVVGGTNKTVYQYSIGSQWDLSSSTSIASFGGDSSLQAGTIIHCKASVSSGTLSVTHNATSLKIPGSTNLTLADGDMFDVRKTSDSNPYWEVLNLTRASFSPGCAWQPATATSVTSGTTSDLSVPSGARCVVVSIINLSTNGASNILIQLGDSGGVETSGYVSGCGNDGSTRVTSTAGFIITSNGNSAYVRSGHVILTLLDPASNTWIASSNINETGSGIVWAGSGNKSLTTELTTIRLTSVTPDTFDGSGKWNIHAS